MKRKFYRTIIQVEVLSEDRFVWDSLSDVAEAIFDGDCSGNTTEISQEEVTPEAMAALLEAQGSDPQFLLGDGDEVLCVVSKDTSEAQIKELSALAGVDPSNDYDYAGGRDVVFNLYDPKTAEFAAAAEKLSFVQSVTVTPDD